jgi:aryl-phospho-beta-D-glucosidase BglC (GH1 family)/PKD repeat protein
MQRFVRTLETFARTLNLNQTIIMNQFSDLLSRFARKFWQAFLTLGLILLTQVFCHTASAQCAGTTGNWLTASGTKLYDSKNKEVRLTGINWFGFETSNKAPHGLWSRDCKSMLMQIKGQGFNCVRIPYSNAILAPGATFNGVSTAPVADPYTGRMLNVEEGKLTNPLDLLDLIVNYCQELNLKIILDNHSRVPDGYISEELWYTSGVPHSKWISDWVFLADRYKNKDAVIAMDLDNEPHGKFGSGAKWGSGTITTDWRLAAEECGNAILAVNPNVLIMVEGVEEYNSTTYWWGGNLQGAATYPVRLNNMAKLVYSPHEYGPTVYPQPWFEDPAFPTNMAGIWEKNFNFLHTQGKAPMFAGEFGIKSQGGKDEIWFDSFLSFMGQKGYSWTFWCWNPNSGDTGGILADDWTSIVTWKMNKLKPYLAAEIPNGGCTSSLTITASAGTGGTITPSGSVSVSSGTSKTFSITPSTGYTVNAVTVDGTSVGAVTTYTFTNVTANHTISATFKQVPVDTYTITASAGTGGTITPSGNVVVDKAANQTFTIAASSGYQINTVTVDGTSVGAVGTYTFTNVTANHSIAATFKTVTNTQQAYPNGVAWAIPGTIEAVNFDVGGEGVAYHDTTVGNAGPGPRANENVDTEFGTTAGNVGWTVTGEWLEYTVNVSQATNYDIKVQVASSPGGGAYHIEFNGVNNTGLKNVGATGGWATFITQTTSNVALSAGIQVMRVYMDAGNFNIAAITISKSGIVNNNPVARVTASPTSGAAPLAVGFNASTSTDADGDALTFTWAFGDNTSGTGATPSHTYTAAGSYTATVTANDGKGGTSSASIIITVTGGSNNCKFGTPRASALPTTGQKSYSYAHVLGTGGPNLSNVTNFTINWDLQNNGLYQYSVNTSNGVPNWYVDLRAGATYNFNQAQPKITLSNTGFAGLNGQYYVNTVGSDFVMVSVASSFTIYFSNSATPPTCTTARIVTEEETTSSTSERSASAFPNPFDDQITIRVDKPEEVNRLSVMDSFGRSVRNVEKENIKRENVISFDQHQGSGLYIIHILGTSTHVIKVIRK